MNQLGAMWTFFKKTYLGVEEKDGSTVDILHDHVDYDEEFEGHGDDEMKIMLGSESFDHENEVPTPTSSMNETTAVFEQHILEKKENIKWKLCRTTKQALEIYLQKSAMNTTNNNGQQLATNNTSGNNTTTTSTPEKKTCRRKSSASIDKSSSSTEPTKISVTVGNGQFEVESCRDVPYIADSDDPKQKLNIFRTRVKRSSQDQSKLPVLFFCHGGSWRRGDRTHRWFDAYSRMAMRICEEYPCVVVVIGYRLAPGAKTVPDQCEDVLSSFKFCTDNIEKYGGDSNNIAIFGHSAGAHLISLCLLRYGMNLKNLKDPYTTESKDFDEREQLDRQILEKIKAVICVGAVFDVQNVADRIFLTRKFIVEPAFGVADRYDDVSPIYYVERERIFLSRHVHNLKSVPSFYIANAASDLGLEDQGESFATKLKQIYDEYSNGHILWEDESKSPVVKYKRYEEGTNHFTIIGLSHAMGNIYEPLVTDILNFMKQTITVDSFVAKEISKPATIPTALASASSSAELTLIDEEDKEPTTAISSITSDEEDKRHMTRVESLEVIRGTMGL
ncbi:predicted protein [Naegleria gruberi]|uniref:Predicted protein n=1 Tax=Naegleria gruberi TaxID=5762 RepID=D2VNL4_NAEGR|nr:uncharacterized protein NAEGRDRAFT_70542 [Naegleria gruberi]EFC41758.1 predicted protein [Naegleria gruberi]|eukprot:XP_002674502.1 predicted protein [Naegleria gruberi strain NEG-M]